jgi:pimeloyl-ACP methyl ester carboxylesterase
MSGIGVSVDSARTAGQGVPGVGSGPAPGEEIVKRVVAVLVAAVLATSLAGLQGANASSDVAAAATYTPTISLAACGDDQCADFAVPLDWGKPDGAKITLAVRVRPHDPAAGSYLGVMLVNPGGPGQPGTNFVDVGSSVPNGTGQRYDWVGWDPRGVGQSHPSLHCSSSYFGVNRPNYVPTTHRLMRYWKRKAAGYAAKCGASSARALLPHMSTLDNVKDMEALRQALVGDTGKLNFYGFSYGTYLGQVYATIYPERVGRFVLDGVVNPADYWYGANLKQEIWFDRNLKTFFKWIAKHAGAYHLGRDWRKIRSGYYALLKRLDRHPAAHGKLGPDELTDGIIGAPYYVYNWDYIAYAYSRLARHGQGSSMFSLYRSANMGDDNGYAVYLGVQCSDTFRPPWRTQVRDARRIHRKHPYLAWDNTWFNAPCLTWPAPSHHRVAVSGAATAADGGRVLLVNETRDAATPYSGALKLRSLFPSSRLIAGVGGTTHAASLRGVACVDNRIAAFLATGALPARLSGARADVSCPKVRPPSAYAARYAGSARTAGPDLVLPGWRGLGG